MNETPYNQRDLVYLIGQCTVELAYLRNRIAELEQRLADGERSNGLATVKVSDAIPE